MEDFDSSAQLKEKLLIAGIEEITNHGVSGFSLRRVAAACGASCAAPYKHFKNKDDFIEQIIAYVDKRWALLAAQISKAYDDDRQCIAELCVANVRFKIANPLYGTGKSSGDKVIYNEVSSFCSSHNLPGADARQYAVSALVTGTAALIESGRLENNACTLDMLRQKILGELC